MSDLGLANQAWDCNSRSLTLPALPPPPNRHLLCLSPQKAVTETATTLLRCKKAGQKIGRGETARLRARNSDGTEVG